MMVIGEKINGSRPAVRTAVLNRDEGALLSLAQDQMRAGADCIDLNVATGQGSQGDEIASMQWAVELLQRETDVALCIDSADPRVLGAGLAARKGRPAFTNSTNAEKERLRQILPLALEHQTPLVALTMDEKGVPKTVEDRLSACHRIAEACGEVEFPMERVYFDPLVLPVSGDVKQGLVTLRTLSSIREHFPMAKTVLGLSNISYGLPQRSRLNAGFLHMAALAGLDAVIMDPTEKRMMDAVRTADVLLGKDGHCRRYTRACRADKR